MTGKEWLKTKRGLKAGDIAFDGFWEKSIDDALAYAYSAGVLDGVKEARKLFNESEEKHVTQNER